MSEPLLLAASLLSGETAIGVATPPKPETDPWQLVDQMGLLDQKRVQQYQRRSQPLSLTKAIAKPETTGITQSRSYQSSPKSQGSLQISSPAASPQPQTYVTAYRPQAPTPQSLATPQNFSRPATYVPRSNAELFSVRTNALKTGQLYTRLQGDNLQSTWAGADKPPTHEEWKQLLQQEAKSVGAGQGKNRLGVLVGDSLSMWFPSEMLPQGKLWLNQGISGENTSQILQRLGALDTVRPETIYVMAGVNDLKQGASDQTVLNNTRAIVRTLRHQHPYATVVVQSLLPTRTAYLSPQRAKSLNQQIRAIAEQENAGYLNLHDLFVDQEGKLRTDLSTDGLHLNQKGYQIWQQAIQQAESWVARK